MYRIEQPCLTMTIRAKIVPGSARDVQICGCQGVLNRMILGTRQHMRALGRGGLTAFRRVWGVFLLRCRWHHWDNPSPQYRGWLVQWNMVMRVGLDLTPHASSRCTDEQAQPERQPVEESLGMHDLLTLLTLR